MKKLLLFILLATSFTSFSQTFQQTNVQNMGDSTGVGTSRTAYINRPVQHNTPIVVKNFSTGSLPSAASYPYGLAYDETTGSLKFSNGVSWQNLSGFTGSGGGGGDMSKSENLSGLANYTTARSNLGLGSLATQSGTFSGTSSGTNTGDQTVSDASISTTDITTNNFTTSKHGFVPKGTNVGNFLKDDGTWASPSGSGDMVLASVQTVTGAKTFGTIGGAVGKLILAGSTSGSSILNAAAVAGSTTITLPNANSTLPIFSQQITFTGPSTARTVTLPDASFTAARTDASNTFTGENVLGAATTTTSPLNIPSGTVETTSEAGDFAEYDGKAFYSSTAANGRGVIPSVQFTSSTATFSFPNNSSANPVFASTEDAFNLETGVSYFFEGMYEITGMGGTTRTTGTNFGGTASLASIRYYAMIQTGTANALGTTQSTKSCVAASNQVLNATATTAAEIIYVRGIVRCTTAGTFIPNVQHSADPTGTIVVAVNSWFKIEPIGSSTVLKSGNIN